MIIPARDEADNLAPLHAELAAVLAGCDYQIVIVDDGSRDDTAARARAIGDTRVDVLALPARGKSHALQAGLAAARHATAAFLDADGQCDPRDLVRLHGELARADYAVGWRRDRRDPAIKRVASSIANGVHAIVLGDSFHDLCGGCHVFRRACLDGVELFEGAHRFLPYIAQRRGFRVVEVPVAHRPRRAGRSKYGVLDRMWRASIDLVRVKRLYG